MEPIGEGKMSANAKIINDMIVKVEFVLLMMKLP